MIRHSYTPVWVKHTLPLVLSMLNVSQNGVLQLELCMYAGYRAKLVWSPPPSSLLRLQWVYSTFTVYVALAWDTHSWVEPLKVKGEPEDLFGEWLLCITVLTSSSFSVSIARTVHATQGNTIKHTVLVSTWIAWNLCYSMQFLWEGRKRNEC